MALSLEQKAKMDALLGKKTPSIDRTKMSAILGNSQPEKKSLNLFDFTSSPVVKGAVGTVKQIYGGAEKAATGMANIGIGLANKPIELINRQFGTNIKGVGGLGSEYKAPAIQPNIRSNLLQTTAGASSSAIGISAPLATTAFNAAGETKLGKQILPIVSSAIEFVPKAIVNNVPYLSSLPEEEKNDLVSTMVNTWLIKGANKGKIKNIEKTLKTNPGTTIKNIGEGILNSVLPKEGIIPELIQKYKAGTGAKPVTAGAVAGELGLSGTKSKIGVQAEAASKGFWDKNIGKHINKSTTVTTANELLNKVNENISKTVNPTEKAALKTALNKIRKDYEGKNFSAEELANLKSTLQESTATTSLSSAASKKIMKELASNARKTLIEKVKKDTGVDITNSLLKYGQLQVLKEMGQKAIGKGEMPRVSGGIGMGGIYGRILEGLSSVITPVATVVGGTLYRLGNGIEFIGPKGITSLKDIIKYNDKIKLKSTGNFIPTYKELGKTKLKKYTPTNIKPSAPGTLVKKQVDKGQAIKPSEGKFPSWVDIPGITNK